MKHAFENYSQFRDLARTEIILPSGTKAVLLGIEPDLYGPFARTTGATWGLKLILKSSPNSFTTYFKEDGSPVDFGNYLLPARMIDAALQRLPSVAGEMDAVEKAVCEFLAENGKVQTYSDCLSLARYIANLKLQ